MYKVEEYNDSLDLSDFYKLADEKGYHNNSSKEILVDTFKHYDRWATWFLSTNNQFVGSVSAHSLEELGILGDSFRMAARTCVLADLTERPKHMRSTNTIFKQHQHLTAQVFYPLCIEWAGRDKDLYISTNENESGKQRAVHRIYCPTLQDTGVLEEPIELEFRLSIQSFWKFNVETFYEQLNRNWWPAAKKAVEDCLGKEIKI
jgi:hypothetical protein